MKRRSVCYLLTGILLFLISPAPASAQPNIPYQKLLVLIAGPSGDRISPTEQEVVSYLNNLRSEYGLTAVQMGTMHFDRPRESRILKDSLGLDPKKGVTLALVQLSDQGIPIRTLYKRENTNVTSLAADHLELLSKWSQLSGERLPAELTASAPRQPGLNRPPVSRPNDTATDLGPPQRRRDTAFTAEGVTSVIHTFNERITNVWNVLRNAPIREDGNDIVLRESTLGLVEASTELLRASQNGIVFPLPQLEEVRRAGRAWVLSEPQFYLPVELRAETAPLIELLELLETAEYQGQSP